MESYKVLDDINGHQIGSIMGETVVLLVDHQQALAEVERQNVENLKLIDEEHERDLAEKDRAYQQLMEKAVLFATWLKQAMDNEADEAQDADTFLQSPEVQAWKELKC